MRCYVGIDDTDSSRGYCTTYLAYRIACDLRPTIRVVPYPKLVRLNPNIPFKTRGNAAVCLEIETSDPEGAFKEIGTKVEELSDTKHGANSGMVFLKGDSTTSPFESLYFDALAGVVSPHRVRKLLRETGAKSLELGNGMGVVGAASCIGFGESFDHTYELIAYRRKEYWGTRRSIDSASVRKMDARTFPHTFNNYDYQKRKVLIAPHGPDPVFAGIRGDSPRAVIDAFHSLSYDEQLDGHMVYASNQHTDAHLRRELEWKAFSSGWLEGRIAHVEVGAGGHVYIALIAAGRKRTLAAYEPTGDLRRVAKLLKPGDRIRAYGGVRRATTIHPAILNTEKFEFISGGGRGSAIHRGTYISSPRANRHLTKPLIRYGREDFHRERPMDGWLESAATRPLVPA